MLAVKPVMLLVKLPEPVPSDVLLPAVVGVEDMLQQTPRAVTADPPSLVMLPPLLAEVWATEVIAVVVSVGGVVEVNVVKLISLP